MANNSVNRIDTKCFNDAISSMKDAIKLFDDAKDNINSATSPLKSSWMGKGSEKFFDTYDFLFSQLSDESENMKEIYQSLEEILTSYETWDKENKNNIENTQKTMNGSQGES